MNTSSLCQLALILKASASAVESPARKAVENNAESDFFWLLISTAFVAVGIAFEYPEVKHEFIEWLRSRKKPWIIDPTPRSRSRVPLWSLIGFLIVTAGVAGEGIYEGLLGMNDTKIRTMDESSLAADELQIAQLQGQNLKLQKQAGDASLKAANAQKDLAELQKDSLPREMDVGRVASKIRKFKGARIDLMTFADFEPAHMTALIGSALVEARWQYAGVSTAMGTLPKELSTPGIWIEAYTLAEWAKIPEASQSPQAMASISRLRHAAIALAAALRDEGLECKMRPVSAPSGFSSFHDVAVHVYISLRPLPGMPNNLRLITGDSNAK